VGAVDPSLNVIRKFVHLLDVGDSDYAEEFGTSDLNLLLSHAYILRR